MDKVYARVKCVVLHALPDDTDEMLEFDNGLVITPGHPVRVNGVWQRASEMKNGVKLGKQNTVVYNYVLDQSHILLVNGVECVTLGHGICKKGGEHPYLGSNC